MKLINGTVKDTRLYFIALIIFASVNTLLAYNPDQFFLPMLAVPVFLAGITEKFGRLSVVPALCAGILPYFIKGVPQYILLSFIPSVILFLAFMAILKLKRKSSFNFALSFGSVLIGIAIRYFTVIYVIGKATISEYAAQLSFSFKQNIFSYMLSLRPSELKSQAAALQAVMTYMEKDTILKFMPLFLLVESAVTAYIALRCFKTFMRFRPEGAPEVSAYSKIKANPLLLSAVMILYAAGTVFKGNIPSEYISVTAGGLLIFTGMVTFSSSVLHFGVTRFGIKSVAGKLIFTLPSFLIAGGDGMILFSIIDSVFDFRKLTSYGLMEKIRDYMKGKENGDGRN